MVAALETIKRLELKLENDTTDSEYSLANPSVGNPIEHFQVIEISKLLEAHSSMLSEDSSSYDLDHLLRGSRIYEAPPKPRAEPVSSLSWSQIPLLLIIFSRNLATGL